MTKYNSDLRTFENISDEDAFRKAAIEIIKITPLRDLQSVFRFEKEVLPDLRTSFKATLEITDLPEDFNVEIKYLNT